MRSSFFKKYLLNTFGGGRFRTLVYVSLVTVIALAILFTISHGMYPWSNDGPKERSLYKLSGHFILDYLVNSTHDAIVFNGVMEGSYTKFQDRTGTYLVNRSGWRLLSNKGELLNAKAISHDGLSVAWWSSINDFPSRLLLDGKELHKGRIPGGYFKQASKFTFAPTGKGWFYLIEESNQHYIGTKQYSSKKAWLVVNGQAQTAYKSIRRPRYSPDGTELAYFAEGKDGFVLVVNGKSYGRYKGVGQITAVSNQGKTTWAYVVGESSKQRVIHDRTEGLWYEEIGPIALSADGDHIIYAAKHEGSWILVIDDTHIDIGNKVKSVRSVHLSADGSHHAAVLRRQTGEETLYYDFEEMAKHEIIYSVELSPGDGRLAYVSGDEIDWSLIQEKSGNNRKVTVKDLKGQWSVYIGKERIGDHVFDYIYDLKWSLHGKSVAYIGTRGESLFFCQDKTIGPRIDRLFYARSGIFVTGSGFRVLAQKNNRIVIIDWPG